MNYEQAKDILRQNGQEHLLRFWAKLNKAAQKALLEQIESIDFREVARCQKMLANRDKPVGKKKGIPKAPEVTSLSGILRKKSIAAGERELAAGRVGVLLVAGGQGSRLGFDGPKGAYPIGPITNAPLFFFHARKVLALSRRYGARIPFYIMTSMANYADTVAHFEEHGYYGLDKKDVIFFKQGMWPGMTEDGKIILDQPGRIFMSPDGHGGMLAALKANGCFADMAKRGVKTLFYFQVDNPLVNVAEPAFIGLHVLQKAEYSLKLCAKRGGREGLGMVVRRDGHFDMIEYTEMTREMNFRRTADGDLYFKYGSPAIHVFDRAFLEREAEKDMPLHLAHKKIATVDAAGRTVKPSSPNGYKFEKFIFDILPEAKRVALVAFDRRDEFAPVKNASGKDSPETCRAALRAKWRRQLEGEVHIAVPIDMPLEVDPLYMYDGSDILKRGFLLKKD